MCTCISFCDFGLTILRLVNCFGSDCNIELSSIWSNAVSTSDGSTLNFAFIITWIWFNFFMTGRICSSSCELKYFLILSVISDCSKNKRWWIWSKYILVEIFFSSLKSLFCVIWLLNTDLTSSKSCSFNRSFRWYTCSSTSLKVRCAVVSINSWFNRVWFL